MPQQAKITFSDGSTLIVIEDQLIIPIVKYVKDGKTSVSKAEPVEIWNHLSNGLIPSLAELLINCEFFEVLTNRDKIYSSNAVVSIENI